MILFSDIDIPLSQIPSISRHFLNKLQKADITTVGDILSIVPIKHEFRDKLVSLQNIDDMNEYALVSITIEGHEYVRLRRGTLLKILFKDIENTRGELHCYGREFIKNILPVHAKAIVWVKFSSSKKRKSYVQSRFISSQFEIITDNQRMQKIVPYYKVPKSFTQLSFFKVMESVFERVAEFPELHSYQEYYPSTTLNRNDSIHSLHFPKSKEHIMLAYKNLAFDEALLFQLSLELMSKQVKQREKRKKAQTLVNALIKSLPFSLTRGQIQVIHEIEKDMLSEYPMRRLLHGDVGSGKTIVALICALIAIENNEQAVLVAPSKSLAQQHYCRISEMLSVANTSLPITEQIQCCLLTGSTITQERTLILQAIAQNSVKLIIGTHALYSEEVKYKNLRFIVFDEQHRFGIQQRQALLEKSNLADLLLMSATPIPRTLALTLYSNMDISVLHEKPGIKTAPEIRLIDLHNRARIYPFIRNVLQKGEQVFFVFPHIGDEENESKQNTDTISSVLTMQEEIQTQLSPFKLGVLHSKIVSQEQKEIMQAFEQKKIAGLLCTTIIEVGIDIHNATIMCIFNAERFGLAALHQLRGRVGRGTLPGTVMLIYNPFLNDIAKERLKALYTITDGFEIAEKDLKLRGPGDVDYLGLRQSGTLLFQFLDAQLDTELLSSSQMVAKKIAREDPLLEKEEHHRLRNIMRYYKGL